MYKKKKREKICPFRNSNVSQTASWPNATLLKTSTEEVRRGEENAGRGRGDSVWLVVSTGTRRSETQSETKTRSGTRSKIVICSSWRGLLPWQQR